MVAILPRVFFQLYDQEIAQSKKVEELMAAVSGNIVALLTERTAKRDWVALLVVTDLRKAGRTQRV